MEQNRQWVCLKASKQKQKRRKVGKWDIIKTQYFPSDCYSVPINFPHARFIYSFFVRQTATRVELEAIRSTLPSLSTFPPWHCHTLPSSPFRPLALTALPLSPSPLSPSIYLSTSTNTYTYERTLNNFKSPSSDYQFKLKMKDWGIE